MRPKSILTKIALVALVTTAVLACGCNNSSKARRELAEGKKEYRAGNYEIAARHLKMATVLDDDLTAAKFALATVYVALSEPELNAASTPENERYGRQAIDVFQKILEREPKNTSALKGMAFTYFNMKRFDQAGLYYKEAIAADPNNPELYYSVGAVDSAGVQQDTTERKAKHGLGVDEEFKNNQSGLKLCEDIRSANETRVNEGMAMLQKAMEKRQNYDDAMVYMLVLYRQKANMECGNPQAQAEDLRLSRKWADEGMAARKRKGEEALKNKQTSTAKLNPPRSVDNELDTGDAGFFIPYPPVWPLPPVLTMPYVQRRGM